MRATPLSIISTWREPVVSLCLPLLLRCALLCACAFALAMSCLSVLPRPCVRACVPRCRYLEQAFWELDWELFALVKEALHERAYMLRSCPYMNRPLPIMIPIYSWWQVCPPVWCAVRACVCV